jgi:hypothetical protein
MTRFLSIPRRTGQALIVLYQRTISLDHGPLAKYMPTPVCRFHPTCSEYGHDAIGRYGLVKGSFMTAWRVMRCNPWACGGFDPVP